VEARSTISLQPRVRVWGVQYLSEAMLNNMLEASSPCGRAQQALVYRPPRHNSYLVLPNDMYSSTRMIASSLGSLRLQIQRASMF
jgi:hypothetical protein